MNDTAAFHFKQFTVQQQCAAMKVGFDGVLLGAWTHVKTGPDQWSDLANTAVGSILDVGTGTGLIALMLAQRTDEQTDISAIDIDELAAQEASDNFAQSRWSHRLSSKRMSLQDFVKATADRFDLIVCNPPFYEANPDSPRPVNAREVARRDLQLSLPILFSCSETLLSSFGQLSLILPQRRARVGCALATRYGFHLHRIMQVKPLPGRPCHRVLFQFGRVPIDTVEWHELAIEVDRHLYTAEFRRLTREFYLAF